jgi:hypothetical protein
MTNEEHGCAMPRPTAEHARLAANTGTWDVACTYYMDPSQPPMEVKAVETVELLGPFFTTSRFETEFMGAPFVGSATLGFDPAAGHWVSTWIDSMNPFMFQFTGAQAEDGTLTMRGKGPAPGTGQLIDFRTTEVQTDPDHRVFEMFMEPGGGQEHLMFHYEYTRRR